MPDRLSAELAEIAVGKGAVAFGVTDAAPFSDALSSLVSSRDSGRSARLGFTYDDPERATNVRHSFPWAERIVVVGWNYLDQSVGPSPTGALVGRFATSDHYEGLREVTLSLVSHLRDGGHMAEPVFDDNRLVDRAAAVRAGVGWSGKSTMVLAPGHGPWMLLGSVVTDAPLEVTVPMQRGCGTCVACLPACPTGAIDARGLDARRCLATWLQTPGSIPQWIRPRLGRRIYGCDDCLTACPPGHRALAAVDSRHEPVPFAELLMLSDAELDERFSWWFVPRRDGRYLRRNVLVAAGNSGEPETRRQLESHLTHRSSMIRGHAAWAMARGFGGSARSTLEDARARETVPEALDELALAVLMVEHPGIHHQLLEIDEKAATTETWRGVALAGLEGGPGHLEILVINDGPAPTDFGHNDLRDRVTHDPSEFDRPFVIVYDPDQRLESMRRAQKTRTAAIEQSG